MPDMSSQIVIERLECEGYCGVTLQERERPQKLAVDVELGFPTDRAAGTDDLRNTVDYAAVADRIVALVSHGRDHLLETLAEKIVAMLFSTFPAEQIRIWVRKLHAPLSTIAGSVGVRIERTRAATPHRSTEPAPASFLIEQSHRLPKGKALDLAAGKGRNSLHLLRRGMAVEALDRDQEGLGDLSDAAQAGGLSGLTTRTLDLEQDPDNPPDLGHEQYDVIIVFFYLFRPLFGPIMQALKGGGILLYETFLIDNYFKHHHPRRWEFCLAHNELLRLTSSLHVLHYDEGEHHDGRNAPIFTARLVAQKSSSSRP
jgi:FolB domain-containing protein